MTNKKLILLLLFIPLVSCDSSETKENTYSFGEDTWIIEWFYSEEKSLEDKYFDDDGNTFFEVQKNDSISDGSAYYISNVIISKEYYDYDGLNDFRMYFKDSEKTLLSIPLGETGNKYPIYTYKLNWRTKDSIIGNLVEKDSLGAVAFESQKILLLRKPKFDSKKARQILVKKKEDLDLQLISQKEYDIIKNKLSRYITD